MSYNNREIVVSYGYMTLVLHIYKIFDITFTSKP